MIQNGRYKAENNDSIFEQYKIILDVKETENSIILRLIEFQSRYGAAHIEMLFSKSKRAVIRKHKGGHAIRDWEDGSFTFYPFQAGTPYYFEPIKKEEQTDG